MTAGWSNATSRSASTSGRGRVSSPASSAAATCSTSRWWRIRRARRPTGLPASSIADVPPASARARAATSPSGRRTCTSAALADELSELRIAGRWSRAPIAALCSTMSSSFRRAAARCDHDAACRGVAGQRSHRRLLAGRGHTARGLGRSGSRAPRRPGRRRRGRGSGR